MVATLTEAKEYLRVDYPDDDFLIQSMLDTAENICMDILRTEDASVLEVCEKGKIAVLYTTAYLYEHREDAKLQELVLTLRALLGADRKVGF